MKTIKNPAAFPVRHSEDKFNPGMTLRDYFAGQVIVGIVSNAVLWERIEPLEQSADLAYTIANELLKQKYEPKDNG